MAEKNSAPESEPKLVLTRIFNAPRELVFKVWTEPKHILKWWGPKDFTAPHCKLDPRPGGEFHFCMRAPDGKEYWNKGVIHEIAAPEKIVWTMYFSDEQGNIRKPTFYGIGDDFPSEMHDTMTFEVYEGTQTKLILQRSNKLSISKKYMEDVGWNQSLDKFAEALAQAAK